MLQPLASFTGFSVDDINKAKPFYSEIIGIALDNAKMGLHYNLPSGGSLFIYEKSDHVPATFTVLNFIVKNIDAAVQELSDLGINFERYDNMPAQQDSKGILRGLSANMGPDIAWFKDPAGNILSVIQDN
jgi:catechol-2,3-dioxygenase